MSKELARLARDFIKEISAVSDISMRRSKLAHRLKRLTPEPLLHVLKEILEGNAAGNAKAQSVYLALIKNRDLNGAIGYEKMTELYEIAGEKGYEDVQQLLRSSKAKRIKITDEETSHLALKLKHLTLGEKKALARRKDFKNIEFLLYDTNPVVISNLLMNPRITEAEVIKIAASKMTRRPVIEEIFKSDKWISRYRVKKALVFNDNTPIDISLNLCNSLMKKDLKLVVRDGKLDPQIVEKAKMVLKGKR